MQTHIVDSFTDAPFKGNPAGVCFVEAPLSEALMLQIAQELNLSETAFVQPIGSTGSFSIRYFSPKMEIALCGHATLAAAKVVFTTNQLTAVHFRTHQQLDLFAHAVDGQIMMEFPVYTTQPAEAPVALLAALGLPVVKHAAYNQETNILLLEIADPQELAGLEPDYAALYRSHQGINGVLVTAPSGSDGYDFHSRYFWPWSGTNEDPVTGGTHTFLAGYWAARLGKTKLKSFQASQRTGFMQVELVGDRVQIQGQAVIVLAGQLML
jgi:PhzF family phenazine biosynthesis protein